MTPRSPRLGAALLAAAVGCFTGEGLRGQPCKTDDDCNPVPALGDALACLHHVCGTCGDGVVQADEACDDGDDDDADECTNACEPAACGDGHVQANVEACDDANDDRTDACVDCRPATCGDGHVQAGVEACDDADADRTDACVDCQPARCGDGEVHAGEEECDDGNEVDDDACSNDCEAARCGDGEVQLDEACDDANTDGSDECVACQSARCGDGHVWADHEACDDADADDADGCNTACEAVAQHLYGGAAARHLCVLREGRVRCWGKNEWGQLGNDSTAWLGDERSDYPISADVAIDGEVLAVAVGGDHTCAQVKDGAVYCWGWNAYGQLGLPRTPPATTAPGDPAALGEEVAQLVAGAAHTCARLADGRVRCWGINEGSAGTGTLGYAAPDPPPSNPPTPPQFPTPNPAAVPLGGPVDELAAGKYHTCARLGGAVRCWGFNASGQLGVGELTTIGDDETPDSVDPVALGGEASQLAAGGEHTCALLVDGRVRCWGRNASGQLGTETTTPSPVPVPVTLLDPARHPVKQLVAGGNHTCVLLTDGRVLCWGENQRGQLGRGDAADFGGAPGDADDLVAVELAAPATTLRLGVDHSCAHLADGRVTCWGSNDDRQLFVNQRRTTDHHVGDDPGELPPCPAALYAENEGACGDA